MNKAHIGKLDQSGAILGDSSTKWMNLVSWIGWIHPREHHHLTQIFGWPLQATWASISMFDNRSVSLWLCGLDRGIRFNIITDLGIHKSDHESWVISASWSMLQAFGVSSSSKHLWLPNFIPSPQRIPGNRSSTRLQKHVRWCLADLYRAALKWFSNGSTTRYSDPVWPSDPLSNPPHMLCSAKRPNRHSHSPTPSATLIGLVGGKRLKSKMAMETYHL